MDVSELRRLIAERGEKQGDLARLIGIHPTAFSKLLAGKRELKAKEADILRRYFGLYRGEPDAPPRKLPIVGLVAAGAWREGFENIMGYMPSPDPSLSDDAFVVIVEGDSMDLIAQSGDAIIVDPADRDLISGQLYIIRNSAGESTFKRYREGPARLEPCSTNDAHQVIYPGQDEFTIIGRARKKVTDL